MVNFGKSPPLIYGVLDAQNVQLEDIVIQQKSSSPKPVKFMETSMIIQK